MKKKEIMKKIEELEEKCFILEEFYPELFDGFNTMAMDLSNARNMGHEITKIKKQLCEHKHVEFQLTPVVAGIERCFGSMICKDCGKVMVSFYNEQVYGKYLLGVAEKEVLRLRKVLDEYDTKKD